MAENGLQMARFNRNLRILTANPSAALRRGPAGGSRFTYTFERYPSGCVCAIGGVPRGIILCCKNDGNHHIARKDQSMVKITITKDNLLSLAEFKVLLDSCDLEENNSR